MNEPLKHDLRHWLTALLGALSHDDVPLARQVAEQMAALLGEPVVAVLSANAASADVGRMLGDVTVVPADPDVFVRADPAALGRVLMNLAVNARQAGGSATIRAGRDGDHATIAVEDTGPGIPPDVLARMGESGFTTGGGSGLGLAVVREIVSAAGGSVGAESTIGQGTTVTVRWPLHSVMAGEGLVLLVEDEPIVRRLAERALAQAGWRVAAFGSAEDALAAATVPDAVVADVTLPGMDGRALVAALRARWPKLPAVLVSGYADSALQADPGAGKTVFLAKPYALSELVVALVAVVRD
jgi:two-component system cell cycle sensor histidine kinase/response regulator CckA